MNKLKFLILYSLGLVVSCASTDEQKTEQLKSVNSSKLEDSLNGEKEPILLDQNNDTIISNKLVVFWSEFKKGVLNGDKKRVTNLIKFPILVECYSNQEEGGELSKEVFLSKYSVIFSEEFKKELLKTSDIDRVLEIDEKSLYTNFRSFKFFYGGSIWNEEYKIMDEFSIYFYFEFNSDNEWKLKSIHCMS